MQKTNYNKIANTYNQRYSSNNLLNIEFELKQIIEENNCKNVLEAGCGTGRWIKSLDLHSSKVFGLDYSYNMLKMANRYNTNLSIVNGDAVKLPFIDNCFDFIFCVNAVHHFPDKEKFVVESKRTLKSSGTLAVFGVDPHIDKDWYVYKFFDNVYENDLKRFPSNAKLKDIMSRNNFVNIEKKIVEEVLSIRIGEDVFKDPFLEKNGNSQLANLTDKEYEQGIIKIKKQIEKNSTTEFKTSIIFYLISAQKN